ncbi:MAG: glycosyltransferase [Sulfitobacter sp.]
MKNPHILVVNVFFAPFSYGGATIVAEQVAQTLKRNAGCKVTAISLCSGVDLVPYAVTKSEKDGIVNFLINIPNGRQYAEIYDNPQITDRVGRLIDQIDPDLVHVHCVQDIGAGILQAAKLRGLPVVLSVHDFWWICDRQFMIKINQRYCGQNPVKIENCRSCVENFSAARTRFDYLRTQATHVDVITYPSQFAKDLSEASGFGSGKGVVWPNGVNLPCDTFFAAQAARRARDPRVTFGFVGGPSQIKGWPQIKRAFTDLGRDDFAVLPVDGSLDGTWWKDHDLSALSGDWQIHPRFSQRNMDDYYAKIDVLLFMSQWKETFGLAIREALARGIHVIQTDSGGTTEHGAVPVDQLIPIGADHTRLRAQVLTLLNAKRGEIDPWPVDSFDDQAHAFEEIMAPLLT